MTANLTDEPGTVTRIIPPVAPGEPPAPQTWIFTFGLDHPLRNRYVQLAGGMETTRELMSRIFGPANWAGQYTLEMPPKNVNRLTRLNLGLKQEENFSIFLRILMDLPDEELTGILRDLGTVKRAKLTRLLAGG